MARNVCEICSGSGEITKKGKTETCKACRGRGYIVVTQEQKDNDPKPGEWD